MENKHSKCFIAMQSKRLNFTPKAEIPAEIHKYRFYELCDQYADYCRIYTDGSKAGERVASAIV